MIMALTLDFLLGDPANRFHPVAYIGKLIGFLDRLLNKGRFLQIKGGLLVAVVLIVAYLSVELILSPASQWSEFSVNVLSVIVLWLSISVKNLARIANKISRHLSEKRLEKARQTVGQIVGRETNGMSEDAVSRAAIESVSENFVDSLVAPLFFALLGGPQLAFTYRALNTIDAMIGYKNEKYRLFGRAGARLDDLANFIPARLSVVFLALSALAIKASAFATVKSVFAYAGNHSSPNSGFPEAAAAGALGVRLGGPSVYFGREISHGYIGKGSVPGPQDIIRSSTLVITGSIVTAIAFNLIAYLATGKAS